MLDVLYEDYKLYEIEQKYNIIFKDKELLVHAFTHTSFDSRVNQNYERLEFLGDSILQMIMSEYMYNEEFLTREGVMSKKRSKLVNETSLWEVMELESLNKYIILGPAMKHNIAKKGAFVADIYEAFVAAIYIDQGYDVVKKFIYNTLLGRIDYLLNIEENIDYKTSLQELLQQNGDISIKYITEKNDDVFNSIVQVNGVNIGVGTGINKKLAEQQAAKSAIQKREAKEK